jgi:hypothetical protein
MKDKSKPRNCKIKDCKNVAGKNQKTGQYFDICDFHFNEKRKSQKNKKQPEVKKEITKNQEPAKKVFKPKPKDWIDETYDPNYKLVTNVSGAFFINHPKKIRYIRIESRPTVEKNKDNSISIKSRGRKVIDLPFDNLEMQEKAYQELYEVIMKNAY